MIKINPVYKKELKVSVRSVKLSFIILGYNLFLAVIGLFNFFMSFQWSVSYREINFADILGLYITLSVIEFGLVLFIIPAFTSGSISGERERQTLEILLTTKLKPIQIILGKLTSSISTLILLVFSSLPILSIVFIIGGIRFKDLLQLMFLILVTSIFIGSIGIFFSTIFKRTIPATVFTYATVIFLLIGTIVIVAVTFTVAMMNIQSNYNGVGTMPRPKMDWMFILLLLNPILTMTSMMTNQFGSTSYIAEFLNYFGDIPEFITNHWFELSVGLQLLVSILFIFLAAKALNPLRKKRYRNKKRKPKKSKGEIT